MGNFLKYKKEGLVKFELNADLPKFVKGKKLPAMEKVQGTLCAFECERISLGGVVHRHREV